MFEKEAEEYTEKDLGGKYLSSVVAKDKLHAYKLGQYDGFIEGAEFGYNKANEWHYVEDGDLPKEIKEYLVYKIDGYGCKSIQVMQFNNQHCWCVNCQNEIKAWKEIVLPKESEECTH